MLLFTANCNANSEPLVSRSTGPEVCPLEIEAAAHRRCTWGAGICQFEGMGPKRFMLAVDDDTEFRS